MFRSDVALLRVEAQVLDRDNHPITGLGAADFILRDGGRLQKIQSVDSEKMPIDLLLLLDVSVSMRPHVERIAAAVGAAMRQLRDTNRTAIMVFDSRTRLRMSFSNGRLEVEREMQRLLDEETFAGDTDITRGFLDAASYLGYNGRREVRKAIVIVTDDRTDDDRDTEGVLRALQCGDTVVSALIAPDAVLYRNLARGSRGYPAGVRLEGGLRSAGTEEITIRSGGDSMRVEDRRLFGTNTRAHPPTLCAVFLPPRRHGGSGARYPDRIGRRRAQPVSRSGCAVPAVLFDVQAASTGEVRC